MSSDSSLPVFGPEVDVSQYVSTIDRRRLLYRSAQIGGGMLLFSMGPARGALPLVLVPVVQYVSRFALAVGAGVVANYIYDYIEKLRKVNSAGTIPTTFATSAAQSLEAMKNDGFTNVEPRYYEKETSVLYSAGRPKSVEGCVCFLEQESITGRHEPVMESPGKHIAAMMEGPSVVGLTTGTESFKDEMSKTQPEMRSQQAELIAKNIFWPKGTDVKAEGRFDTGYDTPEILTTEDGRLRIDYTPLVDTTGQVTVIAEKQLSPTRWDAILGYEYKLRHTATSASLFEPFDGSDNQVAVISARKIGRTNWEAILA